MSIPQNITAEHIRNAAKEIDKYGDIPLNRRSKKFVVRIDDKDYPPKYVVSQANAIVSGHELAPDSFSGGHETNTFLRERAFEIYSISTGRKVESELGEEIED
jgi:5-methylcytosine-specific restriction protein B